MRVDFGFVIGWLNKVTMWNSDFRAKSRGTKSLGSSGRDKKGDKDSEKDRGRTPVDGRKTAGIDE